nr:uncharacterized protein LOC112984501 [Dromaius novaehollandiae]
MERDPNTDIWRRSLGICANRPICKPANWNSTHVVFGHPICMVTVLKRHEVSNALHSSPASSICCKRYGKLTLGISRQPELLAKIIFAPPGQCLHDVDGMMAILRNCCALRLFVSTLPPLQYTIFFHWCQQCCLWDCAEHWLREAIQVKNNPAGGRGWQQLQPSEVIRCHKSARAVSNYRKSCKHGLRDTRFPQEIRILQPVEGAL